MKKHLLSSVLTCVFTLACSQAFAQQKPEHTASTGNSNTATPAPITVNQKVGSWELHCAYPNNNNKQPNASQGCIAQQSLLVPGKDNHQTPIASLLLEKIKTNQTTTKANPFRLTIVTPLGFSLQEPITLTVNADNKISLPWVACTEKGCIASQTIPNTLQKSLETNKTAHLIIHRVNKTTVTVNFNIEDLHKVFPAMNELINKKTP